MNIFILLIGFPGVGKLAIAKELSLLFPAKIIDNHWFNNPILRLLDDDGTSPLPEGIWEYTGRVRQAVLDAIVAYSAPSANFIFTHAGIEGDQRSIRTFQQIAAAAEQRQALLVPVRLLCDEDELARRISTPARRAHLKSIDVEASRKRSRQACVLDPQHQNTLMLDVTFASPQESAAAIRDHVLNAAGSATAGHSLKADTGSA
ncbi:chloramphenicol phosphotransferase [Rhizobium sp. N122]|uniref:chloramphenicol phosphotransferase n=1 Tax=Rhizobium sp. N122 TaxID=1764272 RepID=UPI000B5ABA87|nr:chloramphenicol phosphotransferase [Rhizobium sp. N122]OWV86536.1 chloramphenicol phosphotransferase [Rhizobium sp. N122]